MENSFDRLIALSVADARAAGIVNPVVCLSGAGSPPAETIYAHLYNRPLPLPEHAGNGHSGVMAYCTVAAAVEALRQHAGLGGRAVANLIKDPPFAADYWVLWLEAAHLAVAAFRDGDLAYESSVGYRGVEYEPPGEDALTVLRVPLRNQEVATICAATAEEALKAAALVLIVTGHCLPTGGEDKMVDLPIGDDELALVLRDSYGHDARAIAEALRSLEKLGDNRDCWLLSVLRGRPELSALAERVQAEMAGH